MIENGRNERFGDKSEQAVYDLAIKAGFQATGKFRSITSPFPVEDRNGIVKKTTTKPDLKISDDNGNEIYVEVTRGSGNNPHKEAQLRVIQAANVTNYIVITGNEIEQIGHYETQQEIKEAFIILFEWFD